MCRCNCDHDRRVATAAVAHFMATAATPPAKAAPRDWFRFVTNKAAKTAEVYIYGDIGETFWGDGVSAQAFVDELNAIDADELAIRINSPGGSAWDGMAIANAIIRHPAKTTTWIDGLAASAASIVAVAGDEVVVSKYGQAMLHNARAIVMGTAKDMREVAKQLDGLNATMATYYADRSSSDDDPAAFARAMERETWYNADEMLAAGLATRIDDSAVREEVESAVATAMAGTAEHYRYSGRPAAPAPVTKETRMATKDDLAKRLGKDPADVTDEDLYKLALEALGDPKPDDKPDDKPADPPAPKADDKPAADAPAPKVDDEGTVTVDAAAFKSLQDQAAMGVQAFKDAQAKADNDIVAKAIDEGRIPVSRKDHYLALMKADRADTTDLLTKRLAPGAAVPLTEMGHAADTTPTADVTEDPRYKVFTKGLI